MIYCNLSDNSRQERLELTGRASDIRDELSAIFTELEKTDAGESLIYVALVQSVDTEWKEKYEYRNNSSC